MTHIPETADTGHDMRGGHENVDTLTSSAPAQPHPGEDQDPVDAQLRCALAGTCDALMELQVRRRAFIADIGTIERRLGALARRMLGWHAALPEAERKRLNTRADKLVRDLMAGKDPGDDAALARQTGLVDHVAIAVQGLAAFRAGRKATEKDMERLAADLPAMALVTATRGFSARGLAIIVGEAGNLSDYANPAKLWKRLGLAPMNGRAGSTWRMKGGLTAEEWITLGYSPARLGQIYGVVTEPLMKANDGKYRALYLREKARFADDGKAARPMHAHRHGMRVMTKELVLDTWRAWHGLPPRVRNGLPACSPGGGLPLCAAHTGSAPADDTLLEDVA
ncbi:hypothetical protein ACVDG3_08745 [Meridianimarinicoccus sp. RP-17]|uniref:hypothetical protein n=1 Tax=Meridianimarinicoccus zhengii TaxID=2056810 RepID=UPI000DAF3719|nr:hypothetical protein [Phycocomes zhengii]